MRCAARTLVLVTLVLALADLALPPLIESHVEAGFCSADCPVQHSGHGTAIDDVSRIDDRHALLASPADPWSDTVAPAVTCAAPDAPRAPPSA